MVTTFLPNSILWLKYPQKQGLREFFNDFKSKIEPKWRFEYIERCLLIVPSAKFPNDELFTKFFLAWYYYLYINFWENKTIGHYFFQKID